jgi:hypothetical protein
MKQLYIQVGCSVIPLAADPLREQGKKESGQHTSQVNMPALDELVTHVSRRASRTCSAEGSPSASVRTLERGERIAKEGVCFGHAGIEQRPGRGMVQWWVDSWLSIWDVV